MAESVRCSCNNYPTPVRLGPAIATCPSGKSAIVMIGAYPPSPNLHLHRPGLASPDSPYLQRPRRSISHNLCEFSGPASAQDEPPYAQDWGITTDARDSPCRSPALVGRLTRSRVSPIPSHYVSAMHRCTTGHSSNIVHAIPSHAKGAKPRSSVAGQHSPSSFAPSRAVAIALHQDPQHKVKWSYLPGSSRPG